MSKYLTKYKFSILNKSTAVKDDDSITDWGRYLEEKRKHFKKRLQKSLCNKLGIDDFIWRETIGVGGYSRVVLATKKDDDRHFVIKILEKKFVVDEGLVNHVHNEAAILKAIDFPLALHLEHFFHDNSYIYFVLPFAQGGDLFSLLGNLEKLFEEEARFYAAQIILALEYLHSLGVVHRDVKLENVMIDNTGYIKLGDFGLSKILKKGRTYTFCGTTDYVSPEIIKARGYGYSTDWWSLGVAIFELCSNRTPFCDKSSSLTLEKIVRCTYLFPPYFSTHLKDLIMNLLQNDITKRLGCTRKGVRGVKEALWFNEIDWLDLINKRLVPPYIPHVDGPLDHSLFEQYSDHKLVISPKDHYKPLFRNICN